MRRVAFFFREAGSRGNSAARGGSSPVSRRRRDVLNESDEAQVKTNEDLGGNLAMWSDWTEMEHRVRATSNGVCGLFLRVEGVPEGEIDEAVVGEYQGDE